MSRFTVRDLLWLTLVVGLIVGWWLDRTKQANVHYTGAEATRSAWLGMFKIEGEVRSLMCRACGRLFLYGVPKADTEQPAPHD